MRNLFLLISVFATSCTLPAQTSHSTWQNLNSLAPGEKIQVVEMNATRHAGAFLSVSDSAIILTQSDGNQTIQKQNVRSVQRMKNRHRGRNTLIGAGIGAGVGAGISAGIWESGGFLGGKGDGAAVGAVIGGLAGAIVGVFCPSHDTLYRVSSH